MSGRGAGEMQHLLCDWAGPFAWPGYEQATELPAIPARPGVYLWTFEYSGGYLIYAAGLTRKTVPKRFTAHTRLYRNGDYNLLDPAAAALGERRLVWKGWGWTDVKRAEFLARRAELTVAAEAQLRAFRIFTADVGTAPRLLERLEAAIMQRLYREVPPFCTVPDKGMHLSARWPHEPPMTVENRCAATLHALPARLQI